MTDREKELHRQIDSLTQSVQSLGETVKDLKAARAKEHKEIKNALAVKMGQVMRQEKKDLRGLLLALGLSLLLEISLIVMIAIKWFQ